MEIKETRAAILVEQKKPLTVAKISLPEELSFGQVLVQVVTSGICGAQINEIEGTKGPDKFLPHLLGHEGCGKVLEIGAGVKRVKKGDRVCMHWRQAAGLQCEAPAYRWNGQKVNAGWVTTFNEYAVVSENRLTPVPDDFDAKWVPLLGCSVTTAMGVINNDAKVQIGQSVVVLGVGGVGLNIVQFARLVLAHPIVGIDLLNQKIEMAGRFGATHAFNNRETPDWIEAVRKIVGAEGADVVVETTGKTRMIETAYELTHPDGKTILVGVPPKGEKVSLYTLPLHFRKILTGSHGGSVQPDLEIPRLIRLWRAGRINWEGLITHEFSLDQINEAITAVRSGEAGRVLIRMDQ